MLWLHDEKKKSKQVLPRTRVNLIIVFKNIYQMFRPVTFHKHMLITDQYIATNYYFINSAIDTLTTLLWRIFILHVFKA